LLPTRRIKRVVNLPPTFASHNAKGVQMISQQTIMQAAQLLGEAAKPARVILFGSYARGDAGEESDLDFLVVESTLLDKFGEMVRLRQVLRPLRIAADVLVCSQAEVNQQQQACSTVVYWALREGKVLYVA
jgi:predicted nucleotidyltransferase